MTILQPKKESTFVFEGIEYEIKNDEVKKKLIKPREIYSLKKLSEYLQQELFRFIWAHVPEKKKHKKLVNGLKCIAVIIMLLVIGCKYFGVDMVPKKNTVSIELKAENEELKATNDKLTNELIINKMYYENIMENLKENHNEELTKKDNEISNLENELDEKDNEIISLKTQNELQKLKNNGS